VTNVCWVLDPKGPALDFLTQLNGAVLKHFGQANVEVGFRIADSAIATAELCSSLCWRIDVDDFARLLAHPAVLDVLVEGKKVEKREIDFKKRFMERRAQQQAAG
jgi:hypothetical protein